MATKIKDGLFVGDAEASQDPEFIELNKITFVINCAGRQLPNLWEQHGLHYLTFPWTSDPDCTLFDGGNVVIEQITSFIDEAAGKGDSVLVHSLEGTGRCISCVAAYLMFRHRWSFEKALDFLCNKRPDAAPNAGFVQQLYRLDLRLYERWYGKSKEPAEDDRIRHDQWIPLVPGLSPGLQTHGRSPAGGQRPESIAFSGAAQGRNAISTVIADAAAGCFGGAASTFPSLGRLTEAQEEEIVLVHSFLNSQPQIDALPPGRVDYEDHVSKELHWIDRPRIDKLTAAGRLGRNSDRRQHMIPVSPRTGRAVPERPGNNSYNALSRGNKASTTVPGTTPPVGILKTTTAPKGEPSVVGNRGDTVPHSSPALEPEACELGCSPSGDTTAAVSGAGGAGGAPLASSSLPSSRRGAGSAKADDEVVVEDLSEPQADRWGGGGGGDGGTEGCDQSEHETASGGELSSRSQGQGSALSPENGTDSSSSGEGSKRTAANSTPGGAPTSEQQGTLFKRGERDVRGPVAPARKEQRQAWDGNSNDSGSSRSADTVGASEAGGGYGTGRIGDSGDEIKSNPTTTVGPDKAGISPPRTKATPTSHERDRNTATGSKPDVGDRATDSIAQVSTAVGKAALPISKQLRRGGSEGSLRNAATEISARTTTTTALAQQDKTRLPHAPVGRAMKHERVPLNVSPGPGWGPDDIRHKDVGSGGERRLGPGSAPPGKDRAYGKWQDEWERKASGPRLYPGADGGGGLQSLQQLAQTPNPQQRRLPSPRPQQELGQGDHRQGSSDSGSIFPQKRPSSAPSQRPDAPEDASSGGSCGGSSALTNPVPSGKAGVQQARASSSVGTPNQGYPAHGLMPSGSTVQMNANTDHGGRRGAAGSIEKGHGGSGGSTRPRYFSQAQEQPVGAGGSQSSNQRNVVTNFGGGGGGGGGGRPSSSMDQSHQARLSPDEAMDAEQRVANAHRSRRDRGNNTGALPRGIRTSQPTAPPSADSPQVRVGSPAPPPTSDRALGATSTGSDHSRARGSTRRSSGVASNAVAPRTKTTGIMRPKAGTLPLPSRRGSNGDGGGGDIGVKGGESARWANPAPRGRHGYGNGSSGSNGYTRSAETRGGGAGGSISSRTAEAYTHLSHGGSPHRSPDGSSQQRHRAGGAPIYRSGSPAPVRGRKPAGNTASTAATDSSRLVYQQRTRVLDNKPQAFGIPPAFRGYMASNGGASDGGGRGTSARRSQAPSPTAAKDRVRRASTGSDRPVSSVPVPRSSFAPNRSEGQQRPSTSEGLTGGSGAGRRGRSASPAPRPTSASGRRRSASPSPASLFTSKIDPSFDRPRWK